MDSTKKYTGVIYRKYEIISEKQSRNYDTISRRFRGEPQENPLRGSDSLQNQEIATFFFYKIKYFFSRVRRAIPCKIQLYDI